MSRYEITWPCCGDTTITDAWEPSECPFCNSAERQRALSAPAAAQASAPAKWCSHCRKDNHDDSECWSTRIGVHDAKPAPMQMPTAFAWPKEIASLAATPAPGAARQETDSARLAWLHTSNKDAEGYEFGVCKVKFDASGKPADFLWAASDSSDVDAAMLAAKEMA